MIGKKAMLAQLLFRTGLLRFSVGTGSPKLVVFNYHRIRPDADDFKPELDEGVFGPSVSQFEQQMAWLARNVPVLSEGEIEEFALGRSPERTAAAVTFDDGYRDNYDLALPVLRRYRIPAFFFIPSNLFDQRRLGWWDLIAYVIKRAAGPSLELDGKRYDLADRDAAIHALHQRMKLESHAETGDLVSRLGRAAQVPLPSADEQSAELMTWDQLREAREQGITIGSHTHNHHVLATLTPEQQREELVQSKLFLEQQLGSEVRSLAYPVGGYNHFTDETRQLARESGYSLAFSFNTGINTVESTEPFDVKRIGGPDDIAMFAATARFPTAFSWY